MKNLFRSSYNLLVYLPLLIPLIYNPLVIDINVFHKLIFSVTVLACSFLLLFLKNLSFEKKVVFYFILLIAFLILIFLSSFINNNISLFFESGFDFYLYLIFSIYFSVISKKGNLNLFHIFTFISIIASVFSFIGILELSGIDFPFLKPVSRPGSTLGLRNFASEYLIASIPFTVWVYINTKKIPLLTLSSIFIFIILSYTLLLRSRISIIIILIYFLSFIFIYIRFLSKSNIISFKKFWFLFFIALTAISVSFIPLKNIQQDRKTPTEFSDSYFKYRYEPNFGRFTTFGSALKLFLDSPIYGIGTNAFPGYYGKHQWDELGDRVVYAVSFNHPHNEFLKVLSENGIITFIIFLAMIFYPFLLLLKKVRNDFNSIPFLICYTGLIANMVVAFPISNISLMILFSFCLGYSFTSNNQDYCKLRIPKIFFIGAVISLIPLIYINYLRYSDEINYVRAMEYKFSNNYKKMNALLEEINKNFYPLDPNKMPIQYYLGIGYFEEGQYEKALECFKNSNVLMPYLPSITSNKATTLYVLQRTKETEKVLLELKSKYGYYYEPQINLLSLYMNSKRYDEAENLIKSITSDPNSVYAKNYNLFLLMKKELEINKSKIR